MFPATARKFPAVFGSFQEFCISVQQLPGIFWEFAAAAAGSLPAAGCANPGFRGGPKEVLRTEGPGRSLRFGWGGGAGENGASASEVLGRGKSRPGEVFLGSGKTAYERRWRPLYDFLLRPGEALIYSPGWILETTHRGTSCGVALTSLVDHPRPVTYMREYYNRLGRLEELSACREQVLKGDVRPEWGLSLVESSGESCHWCQLESLTVAARARRQVRTLLDVLCESIGSLVQRQRVASKTHRSP